MPLLSLRRCFWRCLILYVVASGIAASQTHFVWIENTGNNATIGVPEAAVPKIAGTPLESGDEIGVFTASGSCVGATRWEGANCAITVWGDDSQTPEVDGLLVGERLSYRVWQNSSGCEFRRVDVSYSQGDGMYHIDGVYLLASLVVEGSVSIKGSCLTPDCQPNSIAAVASLLLDRVVASPLIEGIDVQRAGSATDSDVPRVQLYRDLNRNNILDLEDVQLDTGRTFVNGRASFHQLGYTPGCSENLLIVFEISSQADVVHTTSVSIDSGDISGGPGTTVIFQGIATPPVPLRFGLMEFTARVVEDNVTLRWTLADESGTYGYAIQRLNRASELLDPLLQQGSGEWKEIGLINGGGSSHCEHIYIDAHLTVGSYAYRLKQIDVDGRSHYSQVVRVEVDPPSHYSLKQNYPNPFNPSTNISFGIPSKDFVSLKVFDLLGKEVATLVSEELSAGNYTRRWNAADVPSGVYFYRLQAGSFFESKRLSLLK